MWREGILGAGRSAAPAACRSDGTASGCRLGRCSRVGVMRIAVVSLFPVMLPGALGSPESAVQESFTGDLVDWPHYTRPPAIDGRAVPAVLSSGDHAAI